MRTVNEWEVERAEAQAAFDRAALLGYAEGIREAKARIALTNAAIKALTEEEVSHV